MLGSPDAGAPVPQFSSMTLSQSVFFGVPEKVVFAKNCRLKTGDVQVVAAEAGAEAMVSRLPAVASTTAVETPAVVRLAGFIRSSGRVGAAVDAAPIRTGEEWGWCYPDELMLDFSDPESPMVAGEATIIRR